MFEKIKEVTKGVAYTAKQDATKTILYFTILELCLIVNACACTVAEIVDMGINAFMSGIMTGKLHIFLIFIKHFSVANLMILLLSITFVLIAAFINYKAEM